MKIKKAQLKELQERLGMEILRNPITREAWGLALESYADVEELDNIVKHSEGEVCGSVEYGALYEATGMRRYTIYCPRSWFDLWGWR